MFAAVNGEGHAELTQIGLAVGLPRLLIARLDGDHQRGTQDADDDDDHEEFEKRECATRLA